MLTASVGLLAALCGCFSNPPSLPQALAAPDTPGPFGPESIAPMTIAMGAGLTNAPAIYAPLLPYAETVDFDLHRPTAPGTPAGGLLLFMHGFAANPSLYADLIRHLTEWGFVVAALRYDSTASQDPLRESLEGDLVLRLLLATPASFGIDPALPVSVVGHSMGGVAALYLAGAEPALVGAAVAIEPYDDANLPTCLGGTTLAGAAAGAAAGLACFPGSVYVLGGTADAYVGPAPANWYAIATGGCASMGGNPSPRRSAFLELGNFGHFAPLDPALAAGADLCALGLGAVDAVDQNRIVRRFVTGVLGAEVLPQPLEDWWFHAFGEGLVSECVAAGGVPQSLALATRALRCADPILWTAHSALPADPPYTPPVGQSDSVLVGFAGVPGSADALFVRIPGVTPWIAVYDALSGAQPPLPATGFRELHLPYFVNGTVVEFVGVQYSLLTSSYLVSRIAPIVTP